MQLTSGYDRKKTPATKTYRPMTLEEGKALSVWGTSRVKVMGNNGKVYDARLNGAVKTWKTDPFRVEIPLKYGMRECWRARAIETADGWIIEGLLVETDG